MLLSRHPLPPLFTPEETESAQSVATHTGNLFSDLKQWDIRNWAEEEEENEPGNFSQTFPHLHTLFVVSPSPLWEVQQLQKGLLFTFGRLVQEAVRQYGPRVLGEGHSCHAQGKKKEGGMWWRWRGWAHSMRTLTW